MSSSYQLTTSLRIIKQPQWVKESIKGVTPSSAAFVAIPTVEFSPTTNSRNVKLTKLGSADVTKTIEDATDYDLSITYAPIDITLIDAMITLTGAYQRENSFTFLISQEHENGSNALAEMYQIVRGCSISSVTISIVSGEFVTIESEWFATSMSDWSTSHNLPGTPVFAPELSAVPWSALTTGASPLRFDDVAYDIDSFSVTINHNTNRVHLLTENPYTRIEPGIREMSIDMAVVYKDNVISENVKTLTPSSLSIRLHQDTDLGVDTNLVFSDVYLESYDETVDAESTDAKIISYSGTATAVLIQIVGVGRHLTKAIATQTVFISENVVIEKTLGTTPNFVAENFVPENFMVPAAGIIKAVPTQTVTISDSRARLAAKIRARSETAIIVSESRTRLAQKNRAIPTQTTAISDSVTRVKGTAGVNITRAVPTQTVSVSGESVNRLAAKTRRATSS